MKIASLTTSVVPSVAANSVQVMKMAQAFARVGHDVTLYASHGAPHRDPFDAYGVSRTFDLVLAARPGTGKAGAARYLAVQAGRILTGGRADLYYGRAARLLLAAAPLGRPLRYEAHAVPASVSRRAVQRALFALPNFDRLVCISAALADDYAATFPSLDRDRIIVAHDGADPADLSDPLPDHSWPGRSGAVQVGYVGGIYPGRGVETIVDAAGRLPELDFHIVGGDAETVAQWRDRRPPPNVHFHGHLPHADLGRTYARLDMLLAPFGTRVAVHGGGGNTRRWMSPLKIFEYMSTGRPILCTDVPVLREVLRPDDNALLLPPDDVGAWASAISRVAADPELRRRLGESGRHDFEANYTWTRRARTVLA